MKKINFLLITLILMILTTSLIFIQRVKSQENVVKIIPTDIKGTVIGNSTNPYASINLGVALLSANLYSFPSGALGNITLNVGPYAKLSMKLYNHPSSGGPFGSPGIYYGVDPNGRGQWFDPNFKLPIKLADLVAIKPLIIANYSLSSFQPYKGSIPEDIRITIQVNLYLVKEPRTAGLDVGDVLIEIRLFQPWQTGGGFDYVVTKAIKVDGQEKDFNHHVVRFNEDPSKATSFTNIQYRIGNPDVPGIQSGYVELNVSRYIEETYNILSSLAPSYWNKDVYYGMYLQQVAFIINIYGNSQTYTEFEWNIYSYKFKVTTLTQTVTPTPTQTTPTVTQPAVVVTLTSTVTTTVSTTITTTIRETIARFVTFTFRETATITETTTIHSTIIQKEIKTETVKQITTITQHVYETKTLTTINTKTVTQLQTTTSISTITSTVVEVNWLASIGIAVPLLIIGFAIGYLIKRK